MAETEAEKVAATWSRRHAVLARVRRPFSVEPIRTLDAVHPSTMELLGEPPLLVTIVTRDSRFRDNAQALGYTIE